MIKFLKIVTLPITVPVSFVVLGILGMIAFVVLLFNDSKRLELFG